MSRKSCASAVRLILVVIIISVLFSGCTKSSDYSTYIQHPDISRYVESVAIGDLPVLNTFPTSGEGLAYLDSVDADLRFVDISSVHLEQYIDQVKHAAFSTRTIWPNELPSSFNPRVILEDGKNPGLSIRELHRMGITGRGVSIGIIDQILYTGHTEYTDRLVYYREINPISLKAEMHGSAVASFAVGESVGVAPKANLFYIAATLFEDASDFRDGIITYEYYAEAVDLFLSVNRGLPSDERIRVISISRGFDSRDEGYDEIIAAIERARKMGILIVSPSDNIAGMYRSPFCDPDNRSIYRNGSWQSKGIVDSDRIFFPMDSRTYASVMGSTDYEYCPEGGISWVVPYVAGLYALCVQVDQSITPEAFWNALKATSSPISKDGEVFIKNTVDPIALISYLCDR